MVFFFFFLFLAFTSINRHDRLKSMGTLNTKICLVMSQTLSYDCRCSSGKSRSPIDMIIAPKKNEMKKNTSSREPGHDTIQIRIK